MCTLFVQFDMFSISTIFVVNAGISRNCAFKQLTRGETHLKTRKHFKHEQQLLQRCRDKPPLFTRQETS